jgi:hypothetical protein
VIISHNMIDIARHSLDSIFLKRENQQIRTKLRILSNRIGEQDLDENVSLALDTICNSVNARYGLVVLFDHAQVAVFSRYNTRIDNLSVAVEPLLTDDIRHIEPNELPPPLEEAALLIPFYWDSNQVGAMILGRPANSTKYSMEDVELLVYPSDRLSDVIRSAQRESEYIQKLSQIVDQADVKENISVKDVENALRNLYDYAYLSDLPLAHLKVVDTRLSAGEVTHIDRGKAVHKVFSEAISKLRPDSDNPEDPPPREWYPYIILKQAYFEDKLNRDIMSMLYISEGTFNRTRRAAIRSVARVIAEMEMHVQ